MAVLILGPLTFLIFLTRALAKRFKSVGANTGLLIGLILVALITYYVGELQKSYLDGLKKLSDENLPNRGQMYADIENRISWAWRVLLFWLVSAVLLSTGTIRQLRKKYPNELE
jgi:energy-coupling factor transporter transmembrane protein EcfT